MFYSKYILAVRSVDGYKVTNSAFFYVIYGSDLLLKTDCKCIVGGCGIRIPKALFEAVSLAGGETILLDVRSEGLLIRKLPRKKVNIKEYLEGYYGKPIEKIEIVEHNDYDWGELMGEEIW